MRKIFYTLGAAAAVATPLIAVVSCGSNEDKTEATSKTSNTPTQVNQEIPGMKDITIDVRIPDWTKETAFDASKFDSTKYIENWHYARRTGEVHSMVPYVIDREFKISSTTALTLGGLMDELNKTGDIFKFNMDLADAGEMGRFLNGIKKSDEELAKVKNLATDSYWGMHYEDNGYGDIIMTDDDHYSYISLSSPNNAQTVLDSHVGFDKHESFYLFDQRLPKGVDNIHISSHDIFYLNLWRMM